MQTRSNVKLQHNCFHSNTAKQTETATNIQSVIWTAERRQSRPRATRSPYEKQIVGAISRGPGILQPCSGVIEEVAAHKQALLAASHTHTFSLHHTLWIHSSFNLQCYYPTWLLCCLMQTYTHFAHYADFELYISCAVRLVLILNRKDWNI